MEENNRFLQEKDAIKAEELKRNPVFLESIAEPPEEKEYIRNKQEIELQALRLNNKNQELKNQELTLQNEGITLRNQNASLKNEGERQDKDERKKYAYRIFWMICFWLCLIITILAFSGWKLGDFILSDTVLITLIGSTTITVAGFFFAVVKYLFPENKDNKSQVIN